MVWKKKQPCQNIFWQAYKPGKNFLEFPEQDNLPESVTFLKRPLCLIVILDIHVMSKVGRKAIVEGNNGYIRNSKD
jgi:hypothetical protein